MLLVLGLLLGVHDRFLVARAKVGDLAGGRMEIGLVGHGIHPIGGMPAELGGFVQRTGGFLHPREPSVPGGV
ncbi:hypothetical protein GCM10010461_27760 [Microbacterium aurantiacum]